MRVHHFARLFVRHVSVKRVDRPVVRALLSPSALRSLQLVLFKLAGVLSQVCRALLVAHPALIVVGVRGVLRDVARPDSLLLAFGRALARDVACVVACRACAPYLDCDECPAAHPLNSCPTSDSTRSTSRMARSNAACE